MSISRKNQRQTEPPQASRSRVQVLILSSRPEWSLMMPTVARPPTSKQTTPLVMKTTLHLVPVHRTAHPTMFLSRHHPQARLIHPQARLVLPRLRRHLPTPLRTRQWNLPVQRLLLKQLQSFPSSLQFPCPYRRGPVVLVVVVAVHLYLRQAEKL